MIAGICLSYLVTIAPFKTFLTMINYICKLADHLINNLVNFFCKDCGLRIWKGLLSASTRPVGWSQRCCHPVSIWFQGMPKTHQGIFHCNIHTILSTYLMRITSLIYLFFLRMRNLFVTFWIELWLPDWVSECWRNIILDCIMRTAVGM